VRRHTAFVLFAVNFLKFASNTSMEGFLQLQIGVELVSLPSWYGLATSQQCPEPMWNPSNSKELWETQATQHLLLGAVNKGNQQLFVRLKNDMYDVYNDSKRGTLSAWSWPSRTLARHAAESCPDNGTEPFTPYQPTVEQMQYCNPGHHHECLKYNAECRREDTVKELEGALAVCVKVDGHVDAYQISNQVAVKIVLENGKLINRFVAGENQPREELVVL